MVTKELTYLIYIIKVYWAFFLIPILTLLFILLEFQLGMNEMGEGTIVLLLFPLSILPIVALFSHIGSLEQKELLITLPLSHWQTGMIRPLILSVLVGLAFTLLVSKYINNAFFLSAFTSILFYFAIASFSISFFKHSGLGVIFPLFYLTFGMFTTGMGQGPFYLSQWYRPKAFTEVNDFIGWQLIAVIILYLGSVFLIKYRSKFNINF
ncbi:hypothetical protein I6G82_18965 [Lysinibacillus macroides]|uniref:Uncharacterized protein n=1 Tax=Lysinibacillus macroides TaxID=33935 RepID=A0A0M9DFU1_9BACI|nr:hypothetical protein [Lysinibacillus macroides]KOY79989.1 hypothetical protein ADM90_22515 [Lysinibacillus macroides]QPR67277.1 hypothetical protein I6G82_18965 [Lysinibacillus macroides]